ncbi:MAG: hypothetical protein LBG47_10645 [Prevotellaceae bacterium]|jgi:hypothetical protein|nr:hypothetical protein [Prevotellaceae bacterium]
MIVLPTLFHQARKHIQDSIPYVVHGQQRVRRMPREYKDNPTPAQLLNRQRIKTLTALYRSLIPVLQRGYPERPRTYSILNAFNHANNPHAFNTIQGVAVLDYSKLRIATGTIPLVRFERVHHVAGNAYAVRLRYSVTISAASEQHTVTLVAVNHDTRATATATAPLQQRTDMVIFMPYDAPAAITLYAYVLSGSGSKASDSTAYTDYYSL